MTRRTFFASLAGVAVVRAVPTVAASRASAIRAENAALAASIREMQAALDAMYAAAARRPVLELDQLSRYTDQLTAEVHLHRERQLKSADA